MEMSPQPAAVGFHELFGLHEHAAGAAGGVVDAALVGSEHLDQEAHHAVWGVELAAVLALGAGEAGEEVFVDAAEQIDGALRGTRGRFRDARRLVGLERELVRRGGRERDGADEVDELAEPVLVERGAGVVLGEHALEGAPALALVRGLDGDHGVVHQPADGRLLGVGLEVAPARLRAEPRRRFRRGIRPGPRDLAPGVVALAGEELGAVLLEGVGDVFEEDQAEDDVLVFGRVHVGAELVCREPELLLEADLGGAGFGGGGATGH